MTLKVIESKTWSWYLGIFLLIVMAMSVSAWYAWFLSVDERKQLKQQVKWLTEENLSLSDNMSANQKQITELGRSEQMAIANISQTGLNLASLQEDKKQLEKELSFYRSIMAPELDKVGLNIDGLLISEIEEDTYEFSLILTQVKKQDWYLKGNYTLELIVETDGKENNLLMNKMFLDSAFKTKFSFRYFQTLTSRFRLPSNLKPIAVLVSASTQDGKQRNSKRFPWTL